jgi:hypothetical protein
MRQKWWHVYTVNDFYCPHERGLAVGGSYAETTPSTKVEPDNKDAGVENHLTVSRQWVSCSSPGKKSGDK